MIEQGSYSRLWQTVTRCIAILRLLAGYISIPCSLVWYSIGAIRHFPVRQIPVTHNGTDELAVFSLGTFSRIMLVTVKSARTAIIAIAGSLGRRSVSVTYVNPYEFGDPWPADPLGQAALFTGDSVLEGACTPA